MDEPPLNAADIHDRIRSGDESFLDRLRRIGGFLPRGTAAYCSGRSGDVGARPQQRAGEGPRNLLSHGVAPSSGGRVPWEGWMAKSPRRLAQS